MPVFWRMQLTPRRDAWIFGGILWTAIVVLALVRPIDEWLPRVALEITVTVPSAYLLVDRRARFPFPRT
jgi:hypothetical protein